MSEEFESQENLEEAPAIEKTEDAAEAAVEEAEEAKVKPKKKGKGKIVLIVIVVVLVVLIGGGAGVYFGTHDKPGFCNFICHTPMDPYVASYEEGTSVLPLQAAAQAEATDTPIVLSVTLHKESDQQLNCLDCHEPSLGEQITEGMKWISGDYSVPLGGLVVVQGTPREGQKSGEEFCLREGCHEGISNLDDLKGFLADEHRNPHNSHLGQTPCTDCHQSHEQSVMLCTQCHADAPLPDGWLTYSQQQKQLQEAAGAA